VQHWVTLHGVALNVDCELGHYAGIVPCGVSDPRHGVTSLADLGRVVGMPEIDTVLRREFERLLGRTRLIPGDPVEMQPDLHLASSG
jgi:lipoyl(octanoyl) transferase